MKNKKRVIIYITSTILILSIALMLVELPTNKKKDYQLNIDIESNDNITNPINYSDVITKVREEYNNNDIKGILEIENTDRYHRKIYLLLFESEFKQQQIKRRRICHGLSVNQRQLM